MERRTRIRSIEKIAQESDYFSWANQELAELRKRFPNVSIRSFAEFKRFLDELYNPTESIDQYDPESTEELYPERFKRLK